MAQDFESARTFFTVDQVDGCAPLSVTIRVKPDQTLTTCEPFFMLFGDTPIGVTTTGNSCVYTYTYNAPGSYRLEVFTGGGGPNNRDSIRIKVRPNIKPAFDVYSCNGSKVQVKITDKTYEQYFINFTAAQDNVDDETLAYALNMTRTFSYPSVGPKQITVQGKFIKSREKCDAQTANFNAVQTLNKATLNTLSVISPESLQLDYTPQVDTQYKLDIALNTGSQFQQFKTFYKPVAGTASEVINGLDTDNNFYCFRLRTFDPCANQSLDATSICSIRAGLTKESKKLNVSWVTGNLSTQPFRIERDDALLATTATAPYQDAAVTCLKDYCYRVTQSYGPGGPVSRSAKRCDKAFSSEIPASVNNIATVTEPDGLLLKWDQDPAFTASAYTILRSLSNLNFSPVGFESTRTFKDADYLKKFDLSYRISYLDACNNRSPDSRTVRPLNLKGIVLKDNRDSLVWNRYRGYAAGISGYSIRKTLVGGGEVDYTITDPADTVFINPDADTRFQEVIYRVTAIPAQPGLPVSLSDTLKLVRKARVIIPNAFTPDGNGTNETFRISGQFIRSIAFKVFDRWGKPVKETEVTTPVDPTANVPAFEVWDGKNAAGVLMPESSYVWRATFTDLLGNNFNRTGTIALMVNK